MTGLRSIMVLARKLVLPMRTSVTLKHIVCLSVTWIKHSLAKEFDPRSDGGIDHDRHHNGATRSMSESTLFILITIPGWDHL